MINGELVVDNFAGGGGTSTGMEMATGYSVDIAINHDPEAIRMHKANHPTTRHYCESVWDVDPVRVCAGHPVALAWFSPDCKHFSKAKSGKPKDKNIRGLAWVALRWAGKVRPRVIMLENVEEFRTWGPLNRRHRPIKAKQGVTFKRFISQLEGLGYEVDFRELIAADYGAPTMRKRFFMIARCDGRPIVWPEPTHGPRDSKAVRAGQLQPYAGAYTQIDFSRPCPSIFDSAEEIKTKYGIRAQRPLAEKTMRRIARGMQKFVLDNPEPFIIQCNHGGDRKPQDIREPMSTITGKHGFGIVNPYIVPIGYGERKGQEPFEFNPYIKLLFSANDMPRMKDKTGAVLRRLVIIPFNAQFSKEDPDYDPFIKYKLIEPGSIEYLIKLGIMGLRRVLENQDFTRSDRVDRQLEEYEEENNPIVAFLHDLEHGENDIINETTADVYAKYKIFCNAANMQPMSKVVFSKQINKRLNTEIAFRKIAGKSTRIFIKVKGI